MIRCRFLLAHSGLILLLSGALAWPAQADTRIWFGGLSGFGNWSNDADWDTIAPLQTDGALFSLNGTYVVTFTSNETINDFTLTNGNVAFRSDNNSDTRTLTINDPSGDRDLDISGGSLTLGSISSNLAPMVVQVDDRVEVGGAGMLNVVDGSSLVAGTAMLGTAGDGTLVVFGAGSSLFISNDSTQTIGANGNSGTFQVLNGATADLFGSFAAGVSLADSVDNTVGVISVGSGATLNTGRVTIATTTSTATGNILVSGVGSTFTQSVFGVDLTVGSSSGGAGTINVTGGGRFSTGIGAIIINATGTIDVQGGTFDANGPLTMNAGSTLLLNGGALNAAAGLDNSAGGTFDFLDGTLTVSDGAFLPNPGSYILDGQFSFDLPHLMIAAGATMTVSSQLTVGDLQQAQLTIIDGGEVSTSVGVIGSMADGNGTVTVSGTDGAGNPSRWSMSASVFVGNGGTGYLTIDGGAEVINSSSNFGHGIIASLDDSSGAVVVSGTDGAGKASKWSLDGALNVGQNGDGSLAISGGAEVSSAEVTTSGSAIGLGGDGVVTVTGTDGSGLASTWTNATDLFVGNVGTGTLEIYGGGPVANPSAFIGAGSGAGMVTVSGTDELQRPSKWTNAGDLFVGGTQSVARNGGGTLIVRDQGLVEVGGTLKIWGPGSVILDGGSIVTDTLDNSDRGTFNFVAGSLNVNSGFEIGSGDVFPGSLSLDAPRHLITAATTTIASSHSLTLAGGSLQTANLVVDGSFLFNSGVLELTGGTITGLSSLVIPTNGEFRAAGVQSLRITAAAGSTITASGNLTLGDATSTGGFYANGEFDVGDHTVTLADANDVVFDSAAQVALGDGGSPGTLEAANGLTLDFGGNITGFGTVNTPDDPATPLINNGNITGNSLSDPVEPITLTGYVKGVGTCDNCNITGTDAPGFSTAAVNRGSVSYNGTLEIEIGGTTPGSGHDQLNHILGAGIAELGGKLNVELINDFMPQLGHTFDIVTAAGGVNGEFATTLFPDLGTLLVMDAFYGANTVTLAVVPALSGDYNADGAVNATDYTVWRNTLNQIGVGLPADGTGAMPGVPDGVVDQLDYAFWKTRYGETIPGSGSSLADGAANVPEPASYVLILVSIAILAAADRR